MVFDSLRAEAAPEADESLNNGQLLEVTYEKSTPLFRGIERSEWGNVLSFLETGYWPNGFFPDPVSPAEQVKTWVYRFHSTVDDVGKKRLRWSQLPLHLALVMKAPFTVIQKLIEIYPDSIRCTDDEKMLPLHLAMRYGLCDRVVDLLLSSFPDAVLVKAKNDRTPLDCAMRANVLRGRILSTFVQGINTTTTDDDAAQCKQEIAELREKLKGKEAELGSVRSQLGEMHSASAPVQHIQVTNERIQKLGNSRFVSDGSHLGDVENNSTLTTRYYGSETDNCTFAQEQATVVTALTAKSAKLGDGVEQKTVEDTETDECTKVDEKSQARSIALILTGENSIERILTRDESRSMAKLPPVTKQFFQEVCKDEMTVVSQIGSPSLEELRSLQERAMTMDESGIQVFMEGAEQKIATLTTQVASEVQKSDAATREEIKAMQRMIEELKSTAEANAAAAAAKNSNEAVVALKSEIEALRREVKESIAAARSNTEDSVSSTPKRSLINRIKMSRGGRPPLGSVVRPSLDSGLSVGSKTTSTSSDSISKTNTGSIPVRGSKKKSWFSLKPSAARKKYIAQDPIDGLRSDFEALRKQLNEMQAAPHAAPFLPATESTDEVTVLRLQLESLRRVTESFGHPTKSWQGDAQAAQSCRIVGLSRQ